MKNRKSRKTIKTVFGAALIACVIVGVIVVISSLLVEKDGFKTIDPSFEVGGLDENGKYKETEFSIYTKNKFECKGLNVVLDFDSELSYQVYFYDYNETFVSATPQLYLGDEVTVPYTAVYARIVATPIWGEDVKEHEKEIGFFECLKLADKITVKVAKGQSISHVSKDTDPNLVYYDLVEVNKAATCTKKGLATYCCKHCGKNFEVVMAIDPNVHSALETVPKKDSTCYELGYEEYQKCNDCDTNLGNTVINMKPHNLTGEYTTNDTHHWFACTTEGCTFFYSLALHNWYTVPGKDATCTENGYTAHEKCSDCNVTRGYEIIEATGHTLVEHSDENGHWYTCSVCGFESEHEAHTYLPVEGKSATCTEVGYTAHEKCSVCSFTVGYTVIEARHKLGWSYDAEIHEQRCYLCGVTVSSGIHTYVDGTCTVCGFSTGAEIPCIHDYVVVPAKDATCESSGYTEHEECFLCGKIVRYTEIAAKGHTYVDGTCTDCGAIQETTESGITVTMGIGGPKPEWML